MQATVNRFIDKYHPKADGKCATSIVVTFERKKKYYKTAFTLTNEEWDKAFLIERFTKKTEYLKPIVDGINDAKKKAEDVIKEMPVFTWTLFEKGYLKNRAKKDTINTAYDNYISKLRQSGSIGTAISYECSKASLHKFEFRGDKVYDSKKESKLKFTDIDATFLKDYEQWMDNQGRSKATISMYVRSLRSLFNTAISNGEITKEHNYPFGLEKMGNEKGKRYQVPVGRNIKKALQLSDIKLIYNHKPEAGTMTDKAKDFWVFMYLCNGINVKDMCLLTYDNIKADNTIRYVRAKTKNTRRERKEIVVVLNNEAKSIIEKWGNKKKDADTYVFPILKKGLTPVEERNLIQNLTGVINCHMKGIAEKLGIDSSLTTYVARHSFATVLLRSTKNPLLVGNALGHSDIKTTQSYFAGFEDETLKDAMAALTAF